MVRSDKERPKRGNSDKSKANPRSELYEIRWLDAYEMESGWLDLEEALKIKPPEVRSVGYVLKETKEYIILAADIGSNQIDKDVGRVTVIPGQWIVDKKIIL
jgi:hypothetical protein